MNIGQHLKQRQADKAIEKDYPNIKFKKKKNDKYIIWSFLISDFTGIWTPFQLLMRY